MPGHPWLGAALPAELCVSYLTDDLLAALGEFNTASKEWVIRQYDHEVQGRSVVKPPVGPGDGPSEAAVVRPRDESNRGVAIGCGLCPVPSAVARYVMPRADGGAARGGEQFGQVLDVTVSCTKGMLRMLGTGPLPRPATPIIVPWVAGRGSGPVRVPR